MNDATLAHFTHLHVHSHYTLLGGTAAVAGLVNRAVADDLKYLALTDTNALYGVVAFDQACRAAGIRPILGMTVTVAPPPEGTPVDAGWPGRLTLLATGPEGYRSLCRLSSRLQGSADRERLAQRGLSWDDLKANRTGVICLEGGRMGWLERYLRAGNYQAASRYAARLGGIYQENGYLSLELHEPADLPIAREVVALGERFGMPAVAVQPVYCLEPDDAPLLRLLAAIDHNCRVEAVPPTALPANGEPAVTLHWLSPDEMTARFADFPDALTRVGEVTQRCGPALPDGRPLWPALDLPDAQSPEVVLTAQAQAGLAARFTEPAAAIHDRLQAELEAIIGHGFAPFFLVVADVVRFARETDVPVSTRGSVANSLVAYCLGITTVDPIEHNLVFERFLNPARANLPDIDLDFCSRRRDEVLDYVRRTYGVERVALVATISTMRPKSAVRETAKAYGFDESVIKKMTALLPYDWHPDPRRRDQRTVEDVLAEIEDEATRELIRTAYRLVGQPHHLSIHPGGVVITPGPLTDVVPVQWAPKGFLITQFDHADLETIGLPKLDLLGIRALTVLADTAELIRAHHDPTFRLDEIPLDDARTAEILARGDTIGVFQCESSGAQRTLRQLRAGTVRDLAVANAFFKPGPALGGMARSFVRRYRGEEPVSYLHPALEPILGPTQGVLLFQEQILRIAREIAGLSWEQADHLRRGMSKFQAREMAAMRLEFILGCQRPAPDGPAFTAQQAETLWEQVMPFAGYGFNQGHATAYADISYRSAYLRAHYPAEFLCARLADAGGFHHPAIYLAEAVRLGIGVRPPHVNVSRRKITLTTGVEAWRLERGDLESSISNLQASILWLGLGQVRDLRRESVRAIIAARRQQPFSNLRDLLVRVPLQIKEITHLIQCGALDGLAPSRAALLAEAEDVARAGSVRQMAFGFALETAVPAESPAQRLAWEQHILGQPVSVHPLEVAADEFQHVVPLRQLPQWRNQPVTIAGVRLPGWTGGSGFFLGDGDSYVIVKGAGKGKRPVWQPVILNGRWREDEWGSGWFQAEGTFLNHSSSM